MTRVPLKARYIGYTRSTENHGDEALIWILRDLLAPEIKVIDEGDDYELALLGGGTLINQSPWLIDVFAAALQKTSRGCVVGTGVGDPRFWGDHSQQWVPLLNACDFVGVRGPLSADWLHAKGVDKAVCVGDPYLALSAPLACEPVPRRMAVNLGSTNDSLWGTNDRDLFDFIAELLSSLRQAGWDFVYYSVWSKDLPLLAELRERIGTNSGPLFDARSQALETLAALAGCELVLAEKLHAAAMAAVAGTPFLALEYQPKVRDFAASLEMDQWTVSTAERDCQLLLECIKQLQTQSQEVREALTKSVANLRMEFLSFIVEIKNYYCYAPELAHTEADRR